MTDHPDAGRQPRGELQIRTLAMPADANPNGDIFGGWLLSQMDVAGGIFASQRARGRVATVAIDAMAFHLPVNVGDVLCCYADLERRGRTSMAVHMVPSLRHLPKYRRARLKKRLHSAGTVRGGVDLETDR